MLHMVLSGEAANIDFKVFGLTLAQTHNLPHSRRAGQPLHHQCGKEIAKGHVCFYQKYFFRDRSGNMNLEGKNIIFIIII